jgi:thiamine kinase-like enzyme
MYVEQYLAKERHQEQMKRAEEERVAHQLVELHKLEKRQERAERQLLQAWARVEQIRAVISAG